MLFPSVRLDLEALAFSILVNKEYIFMKWVL